MPASPDSPILPAVNFLRTRIPFKPEVVLVLGSGLSRVADHCKAGLTLNYAEITGFPSCSVEGHAGRLFFGTWRGIQLAVLQGRTHRYEGHTLEMVTRPVRTLAALGASILITTCAAGALNEAVPGTLFVIEDHVNLMGDSPLLGTNNFGAGSSRFLDMADAYDARLRTIAVDASREAAVTFQQGVMACVTGPVYETAAEAELLRRLGAQAVNMSVVPEVVAARACGQRVLGLAILTNQSGSPIGSSAGHGEVIAVAERSSNALAAVLDGVFRRFTA